MRTIRRLYWILCLTLTVFTLQRSFRTATGTDADDTEETFIPAGINHLLDNTHSELQEAETFERVVQDFMQRWEITGASIAVMKDGRLLYSKGFGWADKEAGVPMDVRHIFRIASLSKLITATGIMKLCENGRLSLDARVFGPEGILDDSLFRNIRDRRIEKITVEHLLRHQGGYSIRAGDPLFHSVSVARQLGIDPPVDFDQMVRYAAETRLRYAPGESNLYSNLGYVVLSKVIEKASGIPYESYIRDSILAPIGCRDMHIGRSSYDERFPNEVRYYEPEDTEPVEAYDGSGRLVPHCYGGCDLQVLSGAGGWVASPTELMKFITAIDPLDSRPDILRPATIAYMTARDKGRYPIGWMQTTDSDDWSRTGSLSGSSAMLKRQHDGYTWVFVSNTSSWAGSRFPKKISAMMKQALAKVKEWPDRDLFVVESSADSLPSFSRSERSEQDDRPQATDDRS